MTRINLASWRTGQVLLSVSMCVCVCVRACLQCADMLIGNGVQPARLRQRPAGPRGPPRHLRRTRYSSKFLSIPMQDALH